MFAQSLLVDQVLHRTPLPGINRTCPFSPLCIHIRPPWFQIHDYQAFYPYQGATRISDPSPLLSAVIWAFNWKTGRLVFWTQKLEAVRLTTKHSLSQLSQKWQISHFHFLPLSQSEVCKSHKFPAMIAPKKIVNKLNL